MRPAKETVAEFERTAEELNISPAAVVKTSAPKGGEPEGIDALEKVLSDNPLAVILNSYTTGLSASVMKYIIDDVIT